MASRLNGHELASSGRWWRTGKPGVWQSMGSVGHDWGTEQQTLLQLVSSPTAQSGMLQWATTIHLQVIPFTYRWCTPLYTFPILVPFPIGPEEDVSPFYRQGNYGSSKMPKVTHANKWSQIEATCSPSHSSASINCPSHRISTARIPLHIAAKGIQNLPPGNWPIWALSHANI